MSRPTGQTFTIRAVRDFLKVPIDRRTQCLTELLGWLAFVELERLKTAPADIGPFIWTDDGAGGIRVVEDDRKATANTKGLSLR